MQESERVYSHSSYQVFTWVGSGTSPVWRRQASIMRIPLPSKVETMWAPAVQLSSAVSGKWYRRASMCTHIHRTSFGPKLWTGQLGHRHTRLRFRRTGFLPNSRHVLARFGQWWCKSHAALSADWFALAQPNHLL